MTPENHQPAPLPDVAPATDVAPGHADAAAIFRAAAGAMRMVGVAEVAIFGLLTVLVFRAAGWAAEQLQEFLGPQRITYENAISLKELLYPAAGMIAALGVLPGIAYFAASFRIARGGSTAMAIGLVLAMMQIIVLGALLVRQVGAAFKAGDPPALTVNVLVLGTPMVALMVVVRLLVRCRVALQVKAVARFLTATRRELNP